MTDDALLTRLAALEERLAALEARQSVSGAPPAGGKFWALDYLTQNYPAGAVVYAGHVQLPTGAEYGWQMGKQSRALLGADWQAAAPALAALGHPLRLSILHAVLQGQATTHDLQAHPELSGAGKLYHHLRELQATGWLTVEGRGRYVVPANKVIPLLVILSASCSIEASELV